MSIAKEEMDPTVSATAVKEEQVDLEMDSAASAAAAAIAHMQAAAAAAAASAKATTSSNNFDFDEDMAGIPHDDTMQAVSPESLNDADSGVETKSVDIKSESDHHDADSGDDLPPLVPAANARVMDVRCGNLNGKLYEERFTCPGIHKKCIEFNGRLISPRQFTISAEKDKQKDWKGSIRVGRHNLRTLMEMKKIDFYEHETNCSLKCQSRNYIKNRKQAAMESGLSFLDNLVKSGAAIAGAAHDLEQQPSSSTSFCTDFGSNYSNNDENGYSSSRKGSALEEYVSRMSTSSASSTLTNIGQNANEAQLQTPTPNPGVQMPDAATLANLQMMFKNIPCPPFPVPAIKADPDATQMAALLTQIMESRKGVNNNFATPNANAATPIPAPQTPGYSNEEMLKNGELNGAAVKKIMEQQPTMFWERMREMNLVDEFVAQMSLALEHLKTIHRSGDSRIDAFAAQKLSSIASVLELSDDFCHRIQANYVQSALQREIELKEKRMQEAKEAKRKSDVLEQIFKITQVDPTQLHLLQQLLVQQQQQVDLSNKIRLNI